MALLEQEAHVQTQVNTDYKNENEIYYSDSQNLNKKKIGVFSKIHGLKLGKNTLKISKKYKTTYNTSKIKTERPISSSFAQSYNSEIKKNHFALNPTAQK